MKVPCRRPVSFCSKALELELPVIVCINKMRPSRSASGWKYMDEVLELFMDLDATDEQLDCPFVYASAKDGMCNDWT